MKRFRISSIPALTVLAFSTTTLPLVAALIITAWYVDSITAEGQRAIQVATRSANITRQLGEVMTSMERNARQYHILKDKSLLAMVDDQQNVFQTGVIQLMALPLQTEFRRDLEQLAGQAHLLHRRLTEVPVNSEKAAEVLADFSGLSAKVKDIQAHSARFVRNSIGQLQAAAERATQLLFWLSMALVPGVLIIAAVFVVVIVRPIRQLNRAIHQLGKGDFDKPVCVNGPLDLQDLGERLDWMRVRLHELEQQKSQFLRHVSHELKTPLASLREGSDLLADEVIGPLNDEQADVTQILRNNSVQLQRQIEALLQFNITQTRHLALDIQHLRLDHLIHDVLQDHRLRIRAKQLHLNMKLSPLYLDGDREKLRTVIDNLLSNAVKFSPPGSTLNVALERIVDQIQLRVIDAGPGIAQQDRDRIFDAFYQGVYQTRDAVKGSGMGLSIARAFVELHQGRITLGECEQGTEMRVILPVSFSEAPSQQQESYAL